MEETLGQQPGGRQTGWGQTICPNCRLSLSPESQQTGMCSSCGWSSPQSQPAQQQPAPVAPATPATPAKSMEGALQITINPDIAKRIFNDEDDLQDFLECLSDKELSIIQENPDNEQLLMTLIKGVREDVEDTAKDLEIDN